MTPRQVERHFLAYQKRSRSERNMMMETAYYAALAPHQKRVPKLEDLMLREPRKKMRPEEIRHALELWLGKGPPN